MTTKKRPRRATLDSDDEDDASVGRQILPVANLPGDFNGEPMDGLQYLFMVRRDSKKLPFYTRVENPYGSEPSRPEPKLSPTAPTAKKSHIVLPSEEWRTVFIKRFRNLRTNCLQPTIGVDLPLPHDSARSRLMPDKKERDKWWAFINGRPEFEWNPPKIPKRPKGKSVQQHIHSGPATDYVSQYEVPMTNDTEAREVLVVNEFGEVREEQLAEDRSLDGMEVGAIEGPGLLPTPFATPQPEERYKRMTGGLRHPTPALLKPMDSRYCLHLLMYFTYWITQHLEYLESGQASSSPFSHLSQNHARWMFALLSRVDERLTSDELSTLRGLARACIAFIKDLNKSASTLDNTTNSDSTDRVAGTSGVRWVGDPGDAPLDERACWMIVAIITDFLGQKDLWIDAGSALNG